jgi:hypothetical protein
MKIMKIRRYLEIFTTFKRYFKIKLIIHGSILSLRCISMIELKLF